MISEENLKLICNYSSSKTNSAPCISLSYLETEEKSDDSIRRDKIRVKRDLVIGGLLGDKKELKKTEDNSDEKLENNISFSNTLPDRFPEISINVKNISIYGKKYNDLSDIHFDIISTLNTLTSSPMPNKLSLNVNFNVNITTYPNLTEMENNLANQKKIISKIMMMSNYIAVNGRSGGATTVIIGSDSIKYLDDSIQDYTNFVIGKISNLNVILSYVIDPDKIIVMRAENQKTPTEGLVLVNNIEDKIFYLKETTGWDRKIGWFKII